MKRTSLLLPFPAGISALADSFFAFPETTNHKDNPALSKEAKSPFAAGKSRKTTEENRQVMNAIHRGRIDLVTSF